jgi:mono/diheme cytochrome c family protein
VTALSIGALVACLVINFTAGLNRRERTELINKASHLLAPMVLMPFLGVWYLWTMPEDSRAMALGGSVVMTMFLGLSTGASLLIGTYAVVGLWGRRLYINGATAALLCALAFVATGGGEFVREGVRKPFTIRDTLFATSLTPAEAARMRAIGCVTHDPYPLEHPQKYANEQLQLGAKVFRFHCSVCHTVDGANGLVHLAGSWTVEQKRMNIAQLQRTKTFMPPFAGTAKELEALVQFLSWESAGRPEAWSPSNDDAALSRIQQWLDEVGVRPGVELARSSGNAG